MFNYSNFERAANFDEIVHQIASNGFGVEIKNTFLDEKNLFGEANREDLREFLDGRSQSS
jgi:hypothetical protein